ncbi:MAG: hypothetical protein WC351_03040, partial [Candidatus Izemoplasmatales bacterium]
REINDKSDATEREKNLVTVLEIALEMYKRGFTFSPIDIHKSHATDFLVSADQKSLIMPFVVVDSLGMAAANSVIDARQEKPFISKQDVRTRTKLSRTIFDRLEDLGVFEGMIETDQISLFDL